MCVCVCVCVCIHTYIYIYMYVYIYKTEESTKDSIGTKIYEVFPAECSQ